MDEETNEHYDPDPPTPEEVIAAGEWKYGLAQEADQGLRPTPGREPRQLKGIDMELTLQQKLEFPFPPSAISWRVGNTNQKKVARETNNPKARPTKGQLLAYIDARDVMERLDRACGFPNWQSRYTLADNGLLICEIGIRIDGEWIWRANGAGDTQVEAEKGKCSDAFKRAAVLWGIGRYLYDLTSPWVDLDQFGKWSKDPTLPPKATPAGYMAALKQEAA